MMKKRFLSVAVVLCSSLMPYAPEAYSEMIFNPFLLESDGESVDLSIFKGAGQPEGNYRVHILLNRESVGSRDINFHLSKDKSHLEPCLPPELVKHFDINETLVPELAAHMNDECVPLKTLIPESTTDFNFNEQQLLITVPQASINRQARGYVNPEEWENGITAAMINYNLSGSVDKDSDGNTSDSQFLSLNAGFNWGPWRLRDSSSLNKNEDGNYDIEHFSTYLQRDITPWKAKLKIGDSFTRSNIFDGIQFRGASLYYDEQMLPDSEQGFAPTVHGVARTNAKVIIRQNNYVIYETYVSPGPFVIDDLYSMSNGDYEVVIEESDGSKQQFTQAYAVVPGLVRVGRFSYSLDAGKATENDESLFSQGTLAYGLSNVITLNSGYQLSEHYQALTAGLAINLNHLGAISADVITANSQFDRDDLDDASGQSYQFLYAKMIDSTGTNVQVAGYRYSTAGFYTFSETSSINDNFRYNTLSDFRRQKSSFNANINQQLGKGLGSFYLNISQTEYWNSDAKETLYQLSYTNVFHSLNYSINFNYNDNSDNTYEAEHSLSVSLSMPFDIAGSNTYASYNFTEDQSGRILQQEGLSGFLDEDQQLSYSLNHSRANDGQGSTVSGSLAYAAQYANLNAGFSHDNNMERVNYGANGSIILHSGGITLGQSFSDSAVLVHVKDADNVEILDQQGVQTDSNGYAIVPYATPYRRSAVSLNTNTLSDSVDVDENVMEFVPTAGAIVKVEFKSRIGLRAIITLTKDGKPLPFGTQVTVKNVGSFGRVADDGEVYLSGLPPKGVLTAKWGSSEDQQCEISYQLPDIDKTKKHLPMLFSKASCQ